MTRRWLTHLLLLWMLPWVALAQAPGFATLRLTQGEIATGQGPVPPATGWSRVTVPEVFEQNPKPGIDTHWLRFGFELAEVPAEPLVLLVQRVVLTAEFRLNGSLLNPGVRFEEPGGPHGTKMMNWPHWMVLPPGLFRQGHNELLVRLQGEHLTPAWIGGISIGPPDALRGEYLLRDIPQRQVPQALAVLLLAALAFSLRLWWRERQPFQGLVVATALLWLGQMTLLYLLPDTPLPWRAWSALLAALWIGFHWALLTLLWRLSDRQWSWFPRALQIGSVLPLAGALLVLVLEPSRAMVGLLMLPTNVLRCITTVMLLRWAWRKRTATAWLLAGSELLWFAGPLQLLLVALHVLPRDPFMLDPGSALPLVLVLIWLAAQRLAQQREEAVLQRQAAVFEERQRLMLDMHDGIGSQMVTALRLARRDEVPRRDVAQVIQEALNDLRLVIDAQDCAAQELQALIQQWRQRNQARLEALGPKLDWAVEPLPAPRPLTPPQALQILRILQEALNNALQHGRPSTISITLAPAPGGCELRVADDGAGIQVAQQPTPPRGRGLDNMHRRAGSLGACLEVRAGAERGTVVSLFLPHGAPA